MTNEKSEGKIIKVQKEKGFGFIISNEHKFTKFFFHWTGLVQTVKFTDLTEGMKVKFIPILNDTEVVTDMKTGKAKPNRGPRAIQIEVIG